MKYNPIGSYFFEGEVKLFVKESSDEGRSCRGCWYNGYTGKKRNYPYSCYVHKHLCTSTLRKDKKQVIFKYVK